MLGNTLALAMGRQLQKKQTGFVHLCKESGDLVTHDTIPIFENFLFALALFRSRLADNILEGKALIERLLPFEVQGNFPVYLHDYPRCFDPYLGLRIYPAVFWVTIDFGHVLGGLKKILERLMERIVHEAEELELPNWAEQRLRAIRGQSIGELIQLEEALPTVQLAEKQGVDCQLQLKEMCQLWHPQLQLYIGPASQRHQFGAGPEVTLFDLYMCSWQQTFSSRVKRPHPIHLKAALIRRPQKELSFADSTTPFVHFNPEDEIPLWVAWEDHTLALAKRQLHVSGSAQELLLIPSGDEEMSVNFYLDHHPDHKLTVDGVKASVFRAGQTLKIDSVGASVHMTFSSVDGIYIGHLMRGNRPCQHACKGEAQYRSYDWRIAIRTVKLGASPIRVKLHLRRNTESQ